MTLDELISELTYMRDNFRWPDGSPQVTAFVYDTIGKPQRPAEFVAAVASSTELCLRVAFIPRERESGE